MVIQYLNKLHRERSHSYSMDMISREEYIEFLEFYEGVIDLHKKLSENSY